MKTKLFIIATIVLLCGQNFLYSQETWQYLDGLSDQYLWKVFAQSPDTVYITGASNRFDGQGMIAKSTNGGISWTKTFTTTNNLLKDIVFYNKNIGFVVGENGIVLKTINGGVDWQLKTSGTTQNLNAIAGTGLNNIWAVGDSGLVVHSVDDGETWQKEDLQLTTNLNDIAFKKDTGYIAGNSGLLYKTINAGVVWNKEIIGNIILNSFNLLQDCYSLSLTEHNIYVICGDFGSGYNLLSKNNLTTWQSNLCGRSTCFAFVNDSVGYSVNMDITTGSGSEVDIYNTNNSGNTWSRVFVDWSNNYYVDSYHSDICIVSDTVKYVVCGSTVLKRTPSITTALKETVIGKELVVFQKSMQQNELIVKSNLQPIVLVELFNVSGNKVLNKKTDDKLTETTVDISRFPVGVYLAKVTFDDKTQTVCKWIKQ